MSTTTITIRRENGKIETVDVSKQFAGMTPALFETVKKATKAAGKGECLSYEVTRAPVSDDDIAEIKAHDAKVSWYKSHGFNESDVA